jgi:hypothetical protein
MNEYDVFGFKRYTEPFPKLWVVKPQELSLNDSNLAYLDIGI